MKRLIPITFFLVISFLSNAQFEAIDLSKYKLPEIKRHRLDFKFTNNNSYRKYSHVEDVDHFTFNLNNSLYLNYSFYRNQDINQINSWITLNSDINLDWGKQNGQKFEKEDDYYAYLRSGYEKRYYPKFDKWFFHIFSEFDLSHRNYYELRRFENNGNNYLKYDVDYFNLNPEVNLGFGFGRIEQVGDLRSAIYILEDLYKKDRLEKSPNNIEIYTFANKVAELRNRRFFDSRLRKIYEIQSIDSTLNELGLVNEMDATYFTSLNDMWLFSHEIRNSGTRFQFDVIGRLEYSWDRNNQEKLNEEIEIISEIEKLNNFNELLGGIISFDSYKPLGLKWQRRFNAEFSYLHLFSDQQSGLLHNYSLLNGNVNYSYYWFKSTRTRANFGINGNFNGLYYSEMDTNYEDINKINISLYGKLSYYFSPRLNMSLNLNLYKYFTLTENEYTKTQFNMSSSVSFNYAIF